MMGTEDGNGLGPLQSHSDVGGDWVRRRLGDSICIRAASAEALDRVVAAVHHPGLSALSLCLLEGGIGGGGRFLVVAFIMFDLHLFGTVAFNKIEDGRKGTDQLERLIGMRGAADFLKAQPGLFRVQVIAPPELNIGDSWGIRGKL